MLALLVALAAPPQVMSFPRPPGGEWLAVYIQGKKAGSSFDDLHQSTFQGQPAIAAESRLTLSARVAGASVERHVDAVKYYEPRNSGRLLGFTVKHSGDGGEQTIDGICADGSCTLQIHAAGRVDTKVVKEPGETLEAADPERLTVATGKGQKLPFFDLEKMAPEVIVTRVLGKESRTLDGISVPVVKVGSRQESESLEVVSALAVTDGRTLAIEAGAMTARAATEAQAHAADEGADVYQLGKVKLPGAVHSGDREVTLVVQGLPPEFLKDDRRQTFQDLGGGKVKITLRARGPSSKATLPVDVARFRQELAPTVSIDFDTPEVRQAANAFAPGPKADAFSSAEAILRWVNGTLQKVYGQSSDTASRVLAERRGDCTEHSLLFAALARANGIPARLVQGLVATGDEGGKALYWHEWVEVWAGDWIAVDPTLGQSVADATHLALGRGDDSSPLRVMGNLHVLEVSDRR